jgi:hypothetical protein
MANRTTPREASGAPAATRGRPGRSRVVPRPYTAVIERDTDTGVGSILTQHELARTDVFG